MKLEAALAILLAICGSAMADGGWETGESVGDFLADGSVPMTGNLDLDGNGVDDGSGTGTDGYVLTADGAGGAAWEAASGGSSPIAWIDADFLDMPNNSDWQEADGCPAAVDSNDNSLTVRLCDDSADEGFGFSTYAPSGTTEVVVYTVTRAETAPGGEQGVQWVLSCREIEDNADVTAWSTPTQLTEAVIPTNEFWQYDSTTVTLTTLAADAGDHLKCQIIRDISDGDDDLSGDAALLKVGLLWQ